MSIITFVGAGMMASALSFPACENGNEVRIVGTHLDKEIIEEAKKSGYHSTLKYQLPKGIQFFQIEELEKALEGADAVLSGVSSFGVDWFAQQVLPLIPNHLPILSVTKGMVNTEKGGFISYLAYYTQLYPERKNTLFAIGGPCTSYELAGHDHSVVTFCGKDRNQLAVFKKMFETDYYHISLSEDVEGVECAVALKNAYALGVTLAVGLAEKKDGQIHYNSQAGLFGQSVKEMKKMLALFGFDEENIYLGAGDLYVTVFGGRTRLIGTLLGKGYTFEEATKALKGVTLESLVIANRTAKAVKELAQEGKTTVEEFPLLMHIDGVLNHHQKAEEIPWKAFV